MQTRPCNRKIWKSLTCYSGSNRLKHWFQHGTCWLFIYQCPVGNHICKREISDSHFETWKRYYLPSEDSFPCLPASKPLTKVSIIIASLFMPWQSSIIFNPMKVAPVICSSWPTELHSRGWCLPDAKRQVICNVLLYCFKIALISVSSYHQCK